MELTVTQFIAWISIITHLNYLTNGTKAEVTPSPQFCGSQSPLKNGTGKIKNGLQRVH